MTFEFSFNGMQVETFDEIYERLADGYRSIYGEDINLDPDSPDGQRVGIEAQTILDAQTFALDLYNQIDPAFSSGENLNKLIKFAGIARKPATQSSVDVTINAESAITLPAGYTVKDELGQSWQLNAEASLSSGDNTVTLFASNYGAVSADIDTINEPETIILGVNSVTNPAIAVVGDDEESDKALRIRRDRSVGNPSNSVRGGLQAKLGSVAGVTDVIVYENDTKNDDAITGIPANSFWCVVEGGDVSDIAEVIAKQKTGGAGLRGDVVQSYSETIVRPSGVDLVIDHDMRFDRPVETPLFINVTATRIDSAIPIDIDSLKENIQSREFIIGEDCHAGRIYSFGYKTEGEFVLSDLEVSADNVTFTDERLVSALDGKFTIDVANITVTEVTP